MKASAIVTVLSTVLSITNFALAEPIPADVRTAARAITEPVAIAKRALTDTLFGDKGSGPRYWAWAKLAYEDDYNSDERAKKVEGGQGKPWEMLTRDDIVVKGFVGAKTEGLFPQWPTFTGMKGIVGLDKTNKVIVMAFIGSNDIPTFKQDIKFIQRDTSDIAGEVHLGFYQCYSTVKDQIFEWTKGYADQYKDYEIVITGHSLGGATAHVAAVAWANQGDYVRRTTVFTYGAPRAGDLKFQQTLENNQQGRMANFRHIHDGVTYLPFIHQSTHDHYANPSNRHIFDPSGDKRDWKDASLWSTVEKADDKTSGFRQSTATIARDMMEKFAQHTQYFSDAPAPHKRDDMWADAMQDDLLKHRKRDTPSTTDFRKAESLVGRLRQSSQLNRKEVEMGPLLEEFAQSMKLTIEDEDVMMDYLNQLSEEDPRIEYLKLIEVVAMNRN